MRIIVNTWNEIESIEHNHELKKFQSKRWNNEVAEGNSSIDSTRIYN